MSQNLAQKLIEAHLVKGKMVPGKEIAIRIDQTLGQDATGTMVMLEFEAMGLDQVKTELSAQYVDHNLLQTDFKNPDDHLFLQTSCERFGIWFSRAGGGVSHPVHMERFGRPGKTLLGSDSHTPAAGSLGMLAIGAGGLEVASAMAGEPYYIQMPQIWGVRLTGKLPPWVSAKDVILEMLRRHGVAKGKGKILEYYGPGLDALSAMDRHVIANMGTELGATSTVFPADEEVRRFLGSQKREDQYDSAWVPDRDCSYDLDEEIDLSTLVPLCAKPSSPGNVVPVEEEAGKPIYQAYLGSSANPGLRDFWVPAQLVQGRTVHRRVSFDINPTSRQMLRNLMHTGALGHLLAAGARLHQTGCNGCIGMGQAPATKEISLRTVPRNFPGRSGTKEDKVYLVSPETATAGAITGQITDPRSLETDWGIPYPLWQEPDELLLDLENFNPPLPAEKRAQIEIRKGPNIAPFPEMDPLPDTLEGPVLLRLEDDVSTDEIMPAGAEILPLRSNIPAIAEYVFSRVDEEFTGRARGAQQQHGGFFVVAGENYGQGSSREHAAIAPRYLGLRVAVVQSYARIHMDNLANFGVLPLIFADPQNLQQIQQEDILRLEGLREALSAGKEVSLQNTTRNETYRCTYQLTPRQIEMILAGSRINLLKNK